MNKRKTVYSGHSNAYVVNESVTGLLKGVLFVGAVSPADNRRKRVHWLSSCRILKLINWD
jgi:hypothetical protein